MSVIPLRRKRAAKHELFIKFFKGFYIIFPTPLVGGGGGGEELYSQMGFFVQ